MNNLLNAMKSKFNNLKQNVMLRTVLICSLALLLIFSVTLAWYINNVDLWGVKFETGYIEFNAYVYDADGKRKNEQPISSKDENESKYLNVPLTKIEDAQVGSIGTVYIALESTGSIGIQYKLAFDITGESESAITYLGGYKYNISKVTNDVVFSTEGDINVSRCQHPGQINDEIVTIDRNPVNGTIDTKNGYDIYRLDYTLVNKNEEYTGKAINIYFNIFATQIGGDFEDTQEKGYTYYCSTKEDLDRAKIEAYAGDTIKLSSNIVYYGDLAFNKPINLETNDFTLTVNGNLMYDYVLGNTLKIDAGGLGRIVVQCTKEGVGGNFKIKAPLSEVVLTGSNSSNGDIAIEKNFTVDATNAFGTPGVSFNNIRIVDSSNSRKTVLLESNTRATVSFGTTIASIQSVVNANNIEIVNNGVIDVVNLTSMKELDQTNSPQIYILNNNDINNPIFLPDWSKKFVENAFGICTGNTRIIQSISGSPMTVSGNCTFDNDDIEIEKKNVLVEQIEANNDSRLKIYYQDLEGQTTTIQSILENYFKNDATTDGKLNEVLELEIISVGSKTITSTDISFLNSDTMLSLRQLDMQQAHIYDSTTGANHRLPNSAFANVDKYEKLVLPQSLVEIGSYAFFNSKVENIITIPADVTVFGANWFQNGSYVHFASSVPIAQAADGLAGVEAIFVDEPYINSYRSVFANYGTRIYPTSVLDESKQHFVRNISNDDWEITYHIKGEDTVIGKNVTIDGRILRITSIYDNAYRHNFTGSKLNFADTVEILGAGNFHSNKNITDVNLNNIKSIGNNAFYNCSNLAHVVFGNRLETIGANAFYGCVSLNQEVILPDTMQAIGAAAFQETKITSVNTGGATSIDGQVFYGCTSLISAELPAVQVVGTNATNAVFARCTSLVSVSMPALTKATQSQMFAYCTSLRELYMGAKDDGLTLGTFTFLGVPLTQIKLYVPEENLAFYQSKCPGSIGATMIYPQGEKMGQELVNGFNIGQYIVGNNGDNTFTIITSNLDYTGSFVIPADYNGSPITGIYANAFRNQGFTDVTLTIGDNIKDIGSGAFYGRNGLTKVNFGNSLELIDTYAFSYCAGLSQEIVLPASMKKIAGYAFTNSGILGINTGGTTSVDDRAFVSCTSMVYAVFPEVTVIAESGSNELFASCVSLVSVDMQRLTRVYGSGMFRGCSSLTELYMGAKDANVSLGSLAFMNVDTTKVKLFVPEDVVTFYKGKGIVGANQVYPIGEKLGDKAVNGFVVGDYIMITNDDGYTLVTSNLDFTGNVSIPSEYKGKPITEIYANAFRNQSFTDASLSLGDHVEVIGDTAFYGTSGLNSITMDQVTAVGADAFYGSGIKVLNAPKLTFAGNNAFRKCVGLEVVNIPKMERIDGTYVFAECTSLKSVYFEKVMSLNQYTFSGCKQLEKITINKLINANGDNMPSAMTIEASAPCKIYVPYRSLRAYTNPWSDKPVVSFDIAVKHNGDTYILGQDNDGKYALIDFMPSKSSESLTLPASVTADNSGNISIYSINEGAFSAVSGTLKSITLSASIAKLENDALSECHVMEEVLVDSNNMFFTSVQGVLYSRDAKMLVKYPIGRSGRFDMSGAAFKLTVGIGAGAFNNATKLTGIVFPSSLLVIDSTAFTNCTALNTVEFTGDTPPTLMGTGIFDTDVDGFKMIIPTESGDVVTSYLCAYNFAEYEPYIDLNGKAAPSDTMERNQVSIGKAEQNAPIAMLKPSKDDEEETEKPSDEETTSGDGPNPPQDSAETATPDEAVKATAAVAE